MNSLLKKWIINLTSFFILNLIFIMFDGTSIVRIFNFSDFGIKVLQTGLFTKWLYFYENPFFNIVATFAALHIVITALYDISKVITSK